MSFIIVSTRDFVANPGKYVEEARHTEVIIVDVSVTELTTAGLRGWDSSKEQQLIQVGLKAMYAAGELATEGHGVDVENLLDELKGHAT